MKKLIVLFILAVMCGSISYAQEPVRFKQEGKTFVQQKVARASDASSTDKTTDYTWKDSKGNEYPIVLHQYSRGENAGKWTAYVVKTSEKTGKNYKYYLPDGMSIASQIMEK